MEKVRTRRCLRKITKRKILFLITGDRPTVEAARPCYQNELLPEILRSRGALVDIRCWRDLDLDAIAVSGYNVVTFLWCDDYHRYPQEFENFVEDVLIAAQRLNTDLHILNNPKIVLWNMDKHYLKDLADKGFFIPRTTFIDLCNYSRSGLKSAIVSFAGTHSVVLKPTMSGSSKLTYLIKDPKSITSDDARFMDLVLSQSESGDLSDLILQEYAEEITQGEYSVIFINGRHSHTTLKIPQAGEFRCQAGFGGRTKEIRAGDVPTNAIETSQKILEFLQSRFEGGSEKEEAIDADCLLYLRVDGIMKEEAFVVMEVEAIEPELWLDSDAGAHGLEQLCRILLQ